MFLSSSSSSSSSRLPSTHLWLAAFGLLFRSPLPCLTSGEKADNKLARAATAARAAAQGGTLLTVPFESVQDYLFFLRGICTALRSAGPRACVYLAAAVSDFFIPHSDMSEHKIQSAGGNLEISLR
jgi:phosphopantothenate-cysteine ligase